MGIPQIRFSKFEKKWVEHEFGSIVSEYCEKTTSENEDTLLSCAIEGMFLNSELFSHQRGLSNIGYLKIKKGDLILSAQNLHLGNANVNLRFQHGIISPAYKVYNIVGCGAEFLYVWIKRDATKSFFLNATTAGASLCRKNIEWDSLYRQAVMLPELDEQEKVSDFLIKLEQIISAKELQKKKTETLKSTMLEKMFPKDGAVVPEVRFKGFEKPWQTICLGDVASEITRTDKTSEAPIMMITAANGFIDQSDRYSFNNAGQSLSKYIVLEKGELAYNHGASKLRPYGSCFALEVDDARIPYVYHCFSISDHNPYFVSRVLNNKKTEKQLRKLVTSGARMDGLLNISYEEYTTVSIQLPERDEQDRITDYFKKLETLIVLYQQELDKLQSIKKALLKKMFV